MISIKTPHPESLPPDIWHDFLLAHYTERLRQERGKTDRNHQAVSVLRQTLFNLKNKIKNENL